MTYAVHVPNICAVKPGTGTVNAPADALQLHESAVVDLVEGVAADGTILMHVIRPGWGKGRGNHYYGPDMLRENAHKFTGWRMFVDHLAPEAKKKMGGLPRSIRDLGGRIVESWYDDSVPADPDKGWEQGAVVARCKPTPFVRELIENDPEIVEASISAQAEGVTPHRDNTNRGWAVEGIEAKPQGSVDWVTEAGAGGRVVALMEAVYDDASEDDVALIEAMTDEQFTEYVRERRPELIEALAEDAGATGDTTLPAEEEEDMEITPAALAEALNNNEELSTVLNTIVEARVTAALENIPAVIEEALSTERDLIRAEATADADRRIALRDMRDSAHAVIEAAGFRPVAEAKLKSKFDLTESGPTAALDVVDDLDDDGNVVKKAKDKLREAVQAEITEQRTLLAEAQPTRVRGQGPSKVEESDADGKAPAPHQDDMVGSLLQESGFAADVDPWNPDLALTS